MKIKQKLMILTCISALFLSACDNTSLTSKQQPKESDVVATQVVGVNQITDVTELTNDPFDAADLNNDYDKPNSILVTLDEGKITTDGTKKDGVKIDGTKVTLTKAGEYFISGYCSDGQIVVDTKDAGIVKLVLNNATLNNTKGCPVYIKQATKTILTVAGGTSNSLSDSGDYKNEEDGVTAAVFAQGDLTFNGNGQLSVVGNYQDAVSCNGDFKITAGTEILQAKEDAIVAAKGVSIKNGSFNLQCGGNGIKTTSVNDNEGFIGIESGNYTVMSGLDVLNATGNVYVLNGSFNGTSGGGSQISSTDESWGRFGGKGKTAKGIKAGGDVQIHGGSIYIDSADDSVYAGNEVMINTGCMNLTSGDDGIVANNNIEVNGGSVTLSKCFEGFECNNLTMNGGYVDVTSKDDGIVVAGGNDGSASAKRNGMNQIERTGNGTVTLKNTCINIKSQADAIDVVGDLTIAGGAVRMCGGNKEPDQSIDCSGNYSIQGGAVVVAGKEQQMAQPKEPGTPVVMITYKEVQPKDSVVCVKDSDGKVVFAFCMGTEYDKVLLSQSVLEKGKIYKLYEATLTDNSNPTFGDVQESQLTPGNEIAEFKVDDGITKVE